MATNFEPVVDTVVIDTTTYGSLTTGTDNSDKLEALADTLVAMGAGWTRVASDNFNGVNQGWFVILQHGAGPIYTQICLAYGNALADFDAANLGGQYKYSNRLYIAYKPSTSSANFDHATDDPYGATFISDANSFKFVLCHDQATTFHDNNWKFTWFADAEQVVLVSSDMTMNPNGVTVMSETGISDVYNAGDAHSEIQINWSSADMTPGVETTHGHQCYRSDDGAMMSSDGSVCNGLATRSEYMTNPCNPTPPWFVEKVVLWDDSVAWAHASGTGDNSIKGVVESDLLSYINFHALVDWQQIASGTFLHIHDGLMIGYKSGNGAVPTS